MLIQGLFKRFVDPVKNNDHLLVLFWVYLAPEEPAHEWNILSFMVYLSGSFL